MLWLYIENIQGHWHLVLPSTLKSPLYSDYIENILGHWLFRISNFSQGAPKAGDDTKLHRDIIRTYRHIYPLGAPKAGDNHAYHRGGFVVIYRKYTRALTFFFPGAPKAGDDNAHYRGRVRGLDLWLGIYLPESSRSVYSGESWSAARLPAAQWMDCAHRRLNILHTCVCVCVNICYVIIYTYIYCKLCKLCKLMPLKG
jgi:hypothetical protein